MAAAQRTRPGARVVGAVGATVRVVGVRRRRAPLRWPPGLRPQAPSLRLWAPRRLRRRQAPAPRAWIHTRTILRPVPAPAQPARSLARGEAAAEPRWAAGTPEPRPEGPEPSARLRRARSPRPAPVYDP